jgi:aspartokinase/homoserine dehydrogenase 1
MKFGGTSLGDPQRLARAVELTAAEAAHGEIAVIVSAMGDTTDRLLDAVEAAADGRYVEASRIVDEIAALATTNGDDAARLLSPDAEPDAGDAIGALVLELRQLLYGVSLVRERTPQTMDLVLSFGERLSAAVVAQTLCAVGHDALYVDAREWTVTDASFGDALVDWEATQERLDELTPAWKGRIPIVTGFLGRTPDGRTTTLGRNGSDYTATLLARGISASEVIRWTDVSGVMTGDPAIVKDAYPLSRLSYMEALELANFGARVFHPRTMIPLIESRIPMRIRNTMSPDGPSTLVDELGCPDEDAATSVASLERLALLGVEWRTLALQAQVGERVLRALGAAGVTVWMANQAAHGQALAVVIPHAEVERAVEAIETDLAAERARGEVQGVTVRAPVTMLSLVAEAMGRTVNVAGRFFHALGAIGVGIHGCAQGASSRSISAVIDAAETQVAVRAVHAAFNFAHQEVNLLVCGRGTVGGELLEQIRRQRAALERDPGVAVRVAGILTSGGGVFDEDGVDLDSWRDAVASGNAHPDRIVDALDRLRKLPVPMLIDCTAADGMGEIYRLAVERGIHVVASNKKPLTCPMSELRALREAARKAHRSYLYETTVGASLPVIKTLSDIVRTGDWVHRIDGSFSGTLGYLTNQLMDGVPLGTAVRVAREHGYTEPDPADDLRGLDVARKALILARELDLSVELSDIEVTPFVPEHVLDNGALFDALDDYADEMAARIADARKQGKTLRYLARIAFEGRTRTIRVGPMFVDADHPAARLTGTESFVAFTTERYRDYPLLVQGPGAGGAVTAAGVLADVLSVAQQLRGR